MDWKEIENDPEYIALLPKDRMEVRSIYATEVTLKDPEFKSFSRNTQRTILDRFIRGQNQTYKEAVAQEQESAKAGYDLAHPPEKKSLGMEMLKMSLGSGSGIPTSWISPKTMSPEAQRLAHAETLDQNWVNSIIQGVKSSAGLELVNEIIEPKDSWWKQRIKFKPDTNMQEIWHAAGQMVDPLFLIDPTKGKLAFPAIGMIREGQRQRDEGEPVSISKLAWAGAKGYLEFKALGLAARGVYKGFGALRGSILRRNPKLLKSMVELPPDVAMKGRDALFKQLTSPLELTVSTAAEMASLTAASSLLNLRMPEIKHFATATAGALIHKAMFTMPVKLAGRSAEDVAREVRAEVKGLKRRNLFDNATLRLLERAGYDAAQKEHWSGRGIGYDKGGVDTEISKIHSNVKNKEGKYVAIKKVFKKNLSELSPEERYKVKKERLLSKLAKAQEGVEELIDPVAIEGSQKKRAGLVKRLDKLEAQRDRDVEAREIRNEPKEEPKTKEDILEEIRANDAYRNDLIRELNDKDVSATDKIIHRKQLDKLDAKKEVLKEEYDKFEEPAKQEITGEEKLAQVKSAKQKKEPKSEESLTKEDQLAIRNVGQTRGDLDANNKIERDSWSGRTNAVMTPFTRDTIVNARIIAKRGMMAMLRQEPFLFENFSRQMERMLGEDFARVFVDPLQRAEMKTALEIKRMKEFSHNLYRKGQYNTIDANGKKVTVKLGKLTDADRKNIGKHGIASQIEVLEDGTINQVGLTTLEGMKEKPPHKLTPKQQEVYKVTREYFAGMLDRMNAAWEMVGEKPIKLKNVDYFPLFRRFTLAEEIGERPSAKTAGHWNTPMHEAKYTERKGMPVGSKIKRVGSYRAAEIDPQVVFEKYMNTALRHIHMTPTIEMLRDYMKPIRSGEFDKDGNEYTFSFKHKNPIMYDYITNKLDMFAGDNHSQMSPFLTKVVRTFSRNAAVSLLSGYTSTVLNQYGAIDGTLALCGVKYTMKGVHDLFNPVRNKIMMKNSEHMPTRIQDPAVVIGRAGAWGKLSHAKQKLTEAGLQPMKYTDKQSATITWHSAYRMATEHLGIKGREAFRFADRATIDVQGSGNLVDLASVQHKPIGKALTLFNTFTINRFNWLTHDVAGIGREMPVKMGTGKGKTSWVKNVGRYLAATTFINSVYKSLGDYIPYWSQYPVGADPVGAILDRITEAEDDEVMAQTIAAAALKGIMESAEIMPVWGGALTRGGKGVGGAGLQLLIELFDTAAGRQNAKSWIYLAGRLSGMPFTQEIYKRLYQNKKMWKKYDKAIKARNKKIEKSFRLPSDIIHKQQTYQHNKVMRELKKYQNR